MRFEESQAIAAFSALSQETRLAIVRALVQAGPHGMAAGAIGEAVAASSSAASFHLSHLERASLIQSRRESRSIIYSINFAGLSGLVEFLMRDCCSGHPEVCLPAMAVAEECCPPAKFNGTVHTNTIEQS